MKKKTTTEGWRKVGSNEEVLKKIKTKRRLYIEREKSHLTFLGQIMKKEGLPNLRHARGTE